MYTICIAIILMYQPRNFYIKKKCEAARNDILDYKLTYKKESLDFFNS